MVTVLEFKQISRTQKTDSGASIYKKTSYGNIPNGVTELENF